jgi:hypothetical protein
MVMPGDADYVPATGILLYGVAGGTIQDDGERLILSKTATQETVEALLQIARARYGTRLGVDGDEVFRERLAQVAAAAGLDVTLADPQLEARRQHLRRQDATSNASLPGDQEQTAANALARSEPARASATRGKRGPTRLRKGRSR